MLLFVCLYPSKLSHQSGLQTEEIRNQLQVLERILSTSFRDQDLLQLRLGLAIGPSNGRVNEPVFSHRRFGVLKVLRGSDEKRYTNRKFKSNFALEKCWERETIYVPFGISVTFRELICLWGGYGDDSSVETFSSPSTIMGI